MRSNFFIATNIDEIDSVIDMLKKARKDMKELSEKNNDLGVVVRLRTSTIGSLETGGITYTKELEIE